MICLGNTVNTHCEENTLNLLSKSHRELSTRTMLVA